MKKDNIQDTPEKDHGLDRGDLWYILLLLAVVLLANYRLIFFQETYQVLGDFGHDFEVFFSYNQQEIDATLRRSYFPLWFPGDSFGIPHAGTHLHGSLLTMFQFFLIPFSYPANFIILVLFQYSLLAIFSYLFLRRIGASGPASFFAAVWMALAGNTIRISFLWMCMNAFIAFLFCMWVMVGLIQKATFRRFILLALGGSLLLVSGDVEFMVYFLYFAGLWLLLYSLSGFSSGNIASRIPIIVSVAVVAALLLGSAQLLPSTFFFSNCVRSERVPLLEYKASFDTLPELFFGSLAIISRRLPNIFFGIIPLSLSVFGIFTARRHPAARASLVVFIVMIFVIYLAHPLLYNALYQLPFYSFFLRHYKLYSIFQFSILILTAFGVMKLMRIITHPGHAVVVGAIAVAIMNSFTLPGVSWKIIFFLAMGGLLAGLFLRRNIFVFSLVALTMIDIFSFTWRTPNKLGAPEYWQAYNKLASGNYGKSRGIVMYPAPTLNQYQRNSSLPPQAGVPAGEALDTYLSYPLMNTANFLKAIKPDIVFFPKDNYTQFNFISGFKSTDFLKSSNRHLINLSNLRYVFCEDISLKDAELRPILSDPEYHITPPWINNFDPYRRELIRKGDYELPVLAINESGGFLYESFFDPASRIRFSISLEGNSAASAEFRLLWQSTDGDEPLEIFFRLLQLSDMKQHVESGPFEIPIDISASAKGVLTFKVNLDGENSTATWINPMILNHEKTLRWIAGEGRLMAFENTEALPRARIVHEFFTAAGDHEAVEIMKDGSRYDPKRQVVLFQDAPHLPIEKSLNTTGSESVDMVEHHPEHVLLEAELTRPGWMVLSDTYYPGWRAFVDGIEQRIYRADLTFRGISLERGYHQVLFIYKPVDFSIGLWTSIASLISLVLLSLFKLFIKPSIHDKISLT